MIVKRPMLAVDLGKSRCRVAVDSERGRAVAEGGGAPGLAAAGGVDAAFAAILAASAPLDAPFAVASVGAAGAWAAPDAAATLARLLRDAWAVPAAVTSDVVSAHVGALDGREGVLLIAGTGAAALGVDADGIRLVDGWGPEVGDLGGGSWFGREGVRAVLRASVGLAPPTVLSEVLDAHVGGIEGIQAWLAEDPAFARRLATLAPHVIDAAADGDAPAADIAAEGARLLAASAAAASASAREVALHGGLTDHPWFRLRLVAALAEHARVGVAPVGDALDGALLIGRRTDLPHERFVHRAE